MADQTADLCPTFVMIAELALALGVAPINRYPGCWEHQIDDQWYVAVNAHKEPTKAVGTPRGGVPGASEVPPFSALVFFNGWIAGLLDPAGGVLAAGEGANEDTFRAALLAATERAGKPFDD